MTQAARLESLEKFRAGTIAYLIATDVAARGLDIQGVQVGGAQTGGPARGRKPNRSFRLPSTAPPPPSPLRPALPRW
jgi:hypothetical protein